MEAIDYKNLIYKLDLIDINFLKDFDVEYDLLINDVIKNANNSLCNIRKKDTIHDLNR